jgi:hypothetical protein
MFRVTATGAKTNDLWVTRLRSVYYLGHIPVGPSLPHYPQLRYFANLLSNNEPS